MANEVINTTYVSYSQHIAVRGHWVHRVGNSWLGEISILTPTHVMRFSSTVLMTREALAGYTDPAYLARHADKFIPRTDGYLI